MMPDSGASANGYISRGNMTVVVSIAGLIMIAFGAFLKYSGDVTDQRIRDNREDIKNIERLYLRKDEHQQFKEGTEKDIALIRKTQDQRAEAIVPRAEHNARWKASDDFALLLSNRINDVRANLAAITTPQSQFVRMENDIAELRKQLNEARKPP
jgi:hypothetical protein